MILHRTGVDCLDVPKRPASLQQASHPDAGPRAW
jgi:hypothetical protein